MVVLLFLTLCLLPLWTQSSPAPAPAYTHFFTDDSWAAFEEEVWQEEQASITEAVNAAVESYKISVRDLNQKLDADSRTILFWKITTGVSCGMAAVLGLLFVLSHVIPSF
jgi:hypothetical protein